MIFDLQGRPDGGFSLTKALYRRLEKAACLSDSTVAKIIRLAITEKFPALECAKKGGAR